MARMPRIVVPGYPHHVTQRGNRRQRTFFCDDDYRYYIELLSRYSQQAKTEIWAYCLMPNHYHFLIRQEGESPASYLPQYIFNSYSKYYNHLYDHSGTLFEGKYKVKLVQNEAYFEV